MAWQGSPAATLQWGHAFVSVETGCYVSPEIKQRMLQWGHAFVSVETGLGKTIQAIGLLLQWGHAFVSVETWPTPADCSRSRRFNGATLL